MTDTAPKPGAHLPVRPGVIIRPDRVSTKVFVMREGYQPKPPVTVHIRITAENPQEALDALQKLQEEARAQLVALALKEREAGARA